MIKYSFMSKLISYFYIFSKFSTSVVLLLIIFFMGFALLKLYNLEGDSQVNLENKIKNILNLINNNINNFKKLNSRIDKNEKLISKISDKDMKDFSIKEVEILQQNINNINTIFKDLKEEIGEIKQELISIKKNKTPQTLSFYNLQLKELTDLIILKYENGKNIKKELSMLDLLNPKLKETNIIEKLYVLELEHFYGIDNLLTQFDESTKKFLKNKFLDKNDNFFISFLSNFVNINPSKKNTFEDKDLNVLTQAKKLMLNGDIEESLSTLLLLDKSEYYFYEWITQANIYIKFKSALERVI